MNEKLTFEQELARHGSFLYTGSGRSMLPLIRPARDIIEIGRPEGRCRKFDVVLFRSGDRCVLHRIIRVGAEDYTLAGDFNHNVERHVTDAQIIGVMRAITRDGKRITPDQFGYRCYVRLWCGCFPLRAGMLRVLRRTRAALRHSNETK